MESPLHRSASLKAESPNVMLDVMALAGNPS
jgi:hypothetical protein